VENIAYLWLLAQQTLALPPAGFRKLIERIEDPRQLLHLPPEQWAALALSTQHRQALDRALSRHHPDEIIAESLHQANADLLCWHDADYPALLKEIYDAPPLLYYRGRRELLGGALFAVVGSRRPSRIGHGDAHAFGKALSNTGLTVVSGMALGVDGAAHLGALSGASSTIAVLGTGVDRCYPRGNAALYERIAAEGLLLSEFPLGSPPLRHQFPRRNRLISGMSLGVLVVEAAVRSGSLITAQQALEQNREVFAIPGSIHNPASRGCNRLIKQGAKLVESLDDILEEYSAWLAHTQAEALSGVEARSLPGANSNSPVYQALGFEPVAADLLAQHLGLAIAELLSLLSELEVEGWVEQNQGGWQRCR